MLGKATLLGVACAVLWDPGPCIPPLQSPPPATGVACAVPVGPGTSPLTVTSLPRLLPPLPGGTFALYSILARAANVRPAGRTHETDVALTKFKTMGRERETEGRRKRGVEAVKAAFERSHALQTGLLVVVLIAGEQRAQPYAAVGPPCAPCKQWAGWAMSLPWMLWCVRCRLRPAVQRA